MVSYRFMRLHAISPWWLRFHAYCEIMCGSLSWIFATAGRKYLLCNRLMVIPSSVIYTLNYWIINIIMVPAWELFRLCASFYYCISWKPFICLLSVSYYPDNCFLSIYRFTYDLIIDSFSQCCYVLFWAARDRNGKGLVLDNLVWIYSLHSSNLLSGLCAA